MASEPLRRVKEITDRWLKAKGAGDDLSEVNLPPHRWIVAIDFGTDGTGFAVAETSGKDIFINKHWEDGTNLSYKTKTSILLDEEGNCLAFGSAAETRYTKMSSEEAQATYFFHTVKMILYTTWKETSVTKNTKLTAANGKTMDAQTVFAAALCYIKNCVERHIKDSTAHVLKPTDVLYVLTVPAIWNDAAKNFMRQCAYNVRCSFPKSLEPEAAGIYCRKLPAAEFVDKDSKSGVKEPLPGDSFIIVDAGGGTIDIAVHEIDAMGNVKEIHQASGGPWGGQFCNERLMALLAQIFGDDVVEYLASHSPAGYAEMVKTIEDAKRSWRAGESEPMHVKLNYDMREAMEECDKSGKTCVKQFASQRKEPFEYSKETLTIPSTAVKQALDKIIEDIIAHLSDLLQKPKVKAVTRMFLVGGFSECRYLQNRINGRFKKKLQILVPAEGGLAVLRGAIMFGRNPAVVQQRVARYSYGKEDYPVFDESKHLQQKKVLCDGIAKCKNVFCPLVKIGQTIKLGHTVQKLSDPSEKAQTAIDYILFYAPSEPQYITDEGVKKLGSVRITFPAAREKADENKTDEVYCFGLTELHVLLIHRTSGDFVTYKIDFSGEAKASGRDRLIKPC